MTNALSVVQWSKILFGNHRDSIFNLCCEKQAYSENGGALGCYGCSCGKTAFSPDFYDNVERAIAQAEAELVPLLGFYLQPTEVSERHKLADFAVNAYGLLPTVNLDRAYLINFGEYVRDTDTFAEITIAPDEDIRGNLFQVSVIIPEAPPEGAELEAYYKTTDLYGFDDVQVRGVRITVTQGEALTLTVTGDKYALVPPRVIHDIDCCDETATGNNCYVTEIEIRTKSIDNTNPGNFIWNGYDCNNQPCTTSVKGVCFNIENHALSIVRPYPQYYDSDLEKWIAYSISNSPIEIDVNYISGVPLDEYGNVRSPYAEAVAYLSAHYLDQLGCSIPMCEDCDSCYTKSLENLVTIPAFNTYNVKVGENTETRNIKGVSDKDFDKCLFQPPTLGAIRASRIVRQYSRAKRGTVLI